MERRTLVLLIVAALAVSAALAWLTLSRANFWRPRAAEMRVERETRDVAPFHRIELSGAADVTLVQGTAPTVMVESTGGAPVRTRVHDGTLTIDTHDGGRGWWRLFNSAPRGTQRITVTFTELTEVDASGSVKLRSAGISTPSLHVDVSGAGTLSLDNLQTDDLFVEGGGTIKASINGRATKQRIEISGAGDYQAAQLASETASVDVSGAGKVTVNATRTLRVDISGAGVVTYLGNPAVEKTISGMGSVRRLTDKNEVRANDGRNDSLPRDERTQHRMLIA
jgi:hypothetical protein